MPVARPTWMRVTLLGVADEGEADVGAAPQPARAAARTTAPNSRTHMSGRVRGEVSAGPEHRQRQDVQLGATRLSLSIVAPGRNRSKVALVPYSVKEPSRLTSRPGRHGSGSQAKRSGF